MFSGTKKKWLVLVAIAAFAAIAVACGTDETTLTPSDGVGGVGAQPTQDISDNRDAVVTPPVAPDDRDYDVVEVLAPIENVEIVVLESFPEQYMVKIVSAIPNGCARFSRSEVARDGNTITISVYNTEPAPYLLMACTMIYGMNEENINLGSDFEGGTKYDVFVNDYPVEKFVAVGPAGSTLPPIDVPDGYVVEQAPIEDLEIVTGNERGDNNSDATTYYAAVSWGLTSGCKESLERVISSTSRSTFDIQALVTTPDAEVACTDNYRSDSDRVLLGTTGEGLVVCAVYTVTAGDKSAQFQAISPTVRCPAPEATPTPGSGGGGIIADSLALKFSLESQGADVEIGGRSEFTKLFGVTPSALKIDGQGVVIYEFSPGTSAEKASESVSADGSTIKNPDGTVMSVMWIAPPHFYLFGNSILLYLGSDPKTEDLLDSVAGRFAGGDHDGTAGGGDSEYTTRAAQIEKVSIASTRSIPAQHFVSVTMALGGSCEKFDAINWSVEGREVIIDVTTKVPTAPVPCTLAIIYEDQSVNIGSDFEKGVEYDVIVNGERAGRFVGTDVDFETGAGSDAEFTTRTAQIEKVSIASTRSIPAQHLVSVTMALGGSCEKFDEINWSVEGREVIIDVTTKVPTAPVPCTLAIIYEDQSVNIGSDFEKGVEYDVIVNGERQGTILGG